MNSTTSPEDRNIRSEERTLLLEKLKSYIKNQLISPTFWACCQLADLESLQQVVNIAQINPALITIQDVNCAKIPLLWSRRFRFASLAGSEASSLQVSGQSRKRKLNADGQNWVQRSGKEKFLCKNRDQHRCILTKMGLPEVAHIFPYSMLNQDPGQVELDKTPDFWALLNVFWDNDKIGRWRNKIFPDLENPNTGVETCFNLICLAPHAHMMWSRGIFALKPLEVTDNDTTLNFQFFWQPQPDHSHKDRMDLMHEPLRSDKLNGIGDDFWLSYLENGTCKNIESGQIFSLHTTDPVNQPLPSWDLLEMQWILQRLVRMSGQAELERSPWDDDSTSDLTSDLADNNVGSTFESVMEWIKPPVMASAFEADKSARLADWASPGRVLNRSLDGSVS